jgi:cytochrome b involved in lipid metabolism
LLATVYVGETFSFDNREGAIGATEVRTKHAKPSVLHSFLVEVRMKDHSHQHEHQIDKENLRRKISDYLQLCIISQEDVFAIDCVDDSSGKVVELGCIVSEMYTDQEDSGVLPTDDTYRGMVGPLTRVYLNNLDRFSQLKFVASVEPDTVQQEGMQCKRLMSREVVNIYTNDDEMFPVAKTLLRPCIALTSVVQEGRGKYRQINAGPEENDTETECKAVIDVGACTFDRVLLYLEHEARGETFRFDPLLASELQAAASTLKLSGLTNICNKVLGSFSERVRRKPYRYGEILEINSRGWEFGDHPPELNQGTSKITPTKKSGETFLILYGMVLDITRWLDEHPGGSTVIPTVALNVDCGIFFEIYHVSRQSYLYLKEFYVGELAAEDIPLVPQAHYYADTERYAGAVTCSVGAPAAVALRNGTLADRPSHAFVEQLERVTPWRLRLEDLVLDGTVMHL